MAVRAASALGEAVGHLFERAVMAVLKPTVEQRGYTIRAERMKNGTDNVYQIDAVVFDAHDKPIIIIDPKYIRYKKHNRDKGSWLCVAHHNLRKSHPTIRKSIAVLAGRWSAPSKALIGSFGVESLEVPFEKMAEVLKKHGVEFDWPENAGESVAEEALEKFELLDDSTREKIGSELVEDIADSLRDQVVHILETDLVSLGSRVKEVEVLVKTDQGEMVLYTLPSVTDAMGELMKLVSDRSDIRDTLS